MIGLVRSLARPHYGLTMVHSREEEAMPPADPVTLDHVDDRLERNLETRVWLGVLAVHGAIFNRLNRAFLREFDITLAKFDVLAQLNRSPDGLTQGNLSRQLKVTGGNVTGLVRRMVADGLITREMSATDRRAFVVRLTTKGADRYKASRERHDTLLHEWLGALPQHELETARQSLARLSESILTGRAGEAA
jgi:DNA-binding MarR family transcriptional regulator